MCSIEWIESSCCHVLKLRKNVQILVSVKTQKLNKVSMGSSKSRCHDVHKQILTSIQVNNSKSKPTKYSTRKVKVVPSNVKDNNHAYDTTYFNEEKIILKQLRTLGFI